MKRHECRPQTHERPRYYHRCIENKVLLKAYRGAEEQAQSEGTGTCLKYWIVPREACSRAARKLR